MSVKSLVELMIEFFLKSNHNDCHDIDICNVMDNIIYNIMYSLFVCARISL